MSGGHHDAHSAGPNGITLNELHVADPANTTEMFSIGSSFSVESLLGKQVSKKKREEETRAGWHAYFVLLGNGLIFGLSFAAALIIANLIRGAVDLTPYGVSEDQHVLLFGVLFAGVLLCFCGLSLQALKAYGFKQKVERTQHSERKNDTDSEDDPDVDEEFTKQRKKAEDRAWKKLQQSELTFKDLLAPKRDQVSFGDLQLSYAVNNHAIVVRSLGDRLVAVIGKTLIAGAELGTDKEDAKWRGRHLTPAVVVTLDRHGYKSKLYIHGAHFERPGQNAKESTKRAIAFLEAVRCLKPSSAGGSGHH